MARGSSVMLFALPSGANRSLQVLPSKCHILPLAPATQMSLGTLSSTTQSRPRSSNENVIGLTMSGSLANSSSRNSPGARSC